MLESFDRIWVMSPPPRQPKVYHITHVDNLPAIVDVGSLVCDREMTRRGGPAQAVGMSEIKRRRVEQLAVDCHPGTMVGDYVPFYFCPRSVMLYVIHMANHRELAYRGGQGPIVHLEADLHRAVEWADTDGRPWAFSLSNAGARYAEFRRQTNDLDELDWQAIAARNFREQEVKEAKQAEFLVHEAFPFELFARIGVRSHDVAERVTSAVAGLAHRPAVEVRADWYY